MDFAIIWYALTFAWSKRNNRAYFEESSVVVALLNFSRPLPLLRDVFAHGKRFRYSAIL